MRPPLRGLDVAVVDVETTGLFPRSNRIIEIAVVRTRLGTGEQRTYSTLVNPNRDVGPTRIHGIRARDVVGAPRFDEVAGDVFAMLSGAVVVGHNVAFDKAFLTSEFDRLGDQGSLGLPLCTMRLGRHLDIESDGRSLSAYCEALRIPRVHAHAAEHDAAATTSLLQAFVTLAKRKRIRALQDLDFDVAPVDASGRPALPASGRVHRRGAAAAAQPPQSYLAQLVRRVGPGAVTAQSPQITSYFELLDRVLEDEIVTETEADGLRELIEMSGLSLAAVRNAHRRYLEALAVAALKDAVVTANERRELESVATLLGLEAQAVEEALAEASKPMPTPSLPLASNRSTLAGKSVCFTGELLGSLSATPISRDMAEDLASQAGLKPMNDVTRKLDILVAADPHTMSRKGRKARKYGTRIMAEQAFWRAIGVEVQ
jgi:DNA polymerase-3 subunit epsilon